MESEEPGEIREAAASEDVVQGKVIKRYPDDEPYPSYLIYGRISMVSPLHGVSAYSAEDGRVIIITVNAPHSGRWMDLASRLK